MTPPVWSPISTISGTGIYAVAVGDFNGDGRLDIAAADNSNNQVVVVLQNTDGTFSSGGTAYPVTSNPEERAIIASGPLGNSSPGLDSSIAGRLWRMRPERQRPAGSRPADPQLLSDTNSVLTNLNDPISSTCTTTWRHAADRVHTDVG